ncbi:MAG: replication-associated recombination protein A [candidate division NC10 bacterium]|nr:replication-associated recombination protein A [candidate division NC10 bacterium]
MMDLFPEKKPAPSFSRHAPLADRMRPRDLKEFVGQAHILGEGKPLREAILKDEIASLILWGPPGSGKTTLAHIIAAMTGSHFIPFSAVTAGIKEIKEVIREAQQQQRYSGKRTILFIDEIHRFNKAQQDAFLPHVEKGTIILIGATTENPSFEVIAPLLSRTKVFPLNPLSEEDITTVLRRALSDAERGLGELKTEVTEEALRHIVALADGDARRALNTLEMAVMTTRPDPNGVRQITLSVAEEAGLKKALLYDREGEEHYNLISALHKSLRGSDPDAALYWLGRMLAAGEDPLYLARRMIRFASEDIGNADPAALQVAIAAKEAYHFLGSPEGELALAQCAVYLATAPKSNAVYVAFNEVQKDIQEQPALPVPLHLRNAPTALMAQLGYAKDYQYPHHFPDAHVEQEYLPENLRGRVYYHPTDRGHEGKAKELLERRRRKRQEGQS